MRDPENLSSTASFSIMTGNLLFEATVDAIGFDRDIIRLSLASVLKTIGAAPGELTPDELGVLLPEIDRRLRKLAPDEQVDSSMHQLQRLLLGWEPGP